ncbi:MAG: monooxygenase FAD-binding protein [Firmicutes bacterium]|nr:monooxygenase FAD-binding protein [Bacillota bacterium]
MSDEEKFDAIVIGAGPAGTACAYVLAKEGKSVLLIERGATPGEKNVTGGRLYTYSLELVEKGLYERAPLHKKVVREKIMMLGKESAITIDYVDPTFVADIPQSYTVLRAPFDEWFASEAEAQGAMLASGILVEDLIEENNKIVGVKAGEDEIYADIIIAADGVNSFIAQKAGLREDIAAQAVGVSAKEVIELPDNVIADRFNLNNDEGAAGVIVGGMDGVTGGAFIYTNKDSISLGVVLNPEDTAQHGKKIYDILQDLKVHPSIYPLIKGGTTIEYGAHLVPEIGFHGMPDKLYKDGLLVIGDAAGMCINTGTMIRGIDLAIVSGVAAARAILKNEEYATGDVGQLYIDELENLKLLPTMRLYANMHKILSLPRMMEVYPSLANEMMQFMFKVDGNLPERADKAMLHILKKHVTFGQLISDGWKGFKAL